jgi:hypothetical protein
MVPKAFPKSASAERSLFLLATSIVPPIHYVSTFRNIHLSRATKIRLYKTLYKTLIRPAVTCGAETWTMTKKEEQAMLIFEKKIFRRIYGAKYEGGEWKSRTNRELEDLSKGENTVK